MKTITVTALTALVAALAAGCSGGGGGGTPIPTAGTIHLEQASYGPGEDAGTVTIAAVRAGGSAGAVTVDYATSNGTATAGADYLSASATLSWGDGEDGPKTFAVTILDDAVWEESDAFSVSLQSPTGGAALGTPATAVVTIADDDPAGPGALRWSSLSPWVDEAAGTKTITVVREGGNLGAVSVSYASSAGTATADADYTPVSGSLSWAAGDMAAKSFDVPIFDDALPELYENVKLTLSAPTGGATIASDPEATLTIRNDDAELWLRSSVEGTGEQGERVIVYVERAGATPTPVTVRCATADGTATAGLDYQASAITFTWAAADTSSKWIDVMPIDDDEREGDETVGVTLSSPTGGATLVAPSAVVVTIFDDEPPDAGHLAFTGDQYFAANYGGTATVAVARTGPTATGAVSVSYTTLPGGNATEWVDYLPTSGTLSWADGEAGAKTFQVAIVDDLVADPADWIALAVSGATGGAELGPQQTAQIVIREHWTKDPYQPVLVPGASGSLDFMDVRAPSVVQLGPADYVMFYEALGVTTTDPSSKPRIGRAESADGIVWTKWPDGPVLDAGASGAFDEGGVRSPAVLFDGITWHMWYSTGSDGSVEGSRIGYATSSDGIGWTRQNGASPVLAPLAATWDRSGVGMPTVVKEGATFSMWYVGTYLDAAIGRATSTDGVTWVRDPATPVLTKGATNSWSGFWVHEPAVVKDGATYRMWLEGFNGSNQWIGYATSPDGATWTEHAPNPVFTKGSYGYWDDAGVGAPTVVKDGETFVLWYRGSGDAPTSGIGRATLP